ncbi:MAG: Transcriptional activator protein CzcR [Verrucomicrobia bacterium ADurb.Bin006]|nr:MAG: Transcriptional activator protein CzcR [Verrucomicrobia bacterium ADurb.Bin006]
MTVLSFTFHSSFTRGRDSARSVNAAITKHELPGDEHGHESARSETETFLCPPAPPAWTLYGPLLVRLDRLELVKTKGHELVVRRGDGAGEVSVLNRSPLDRPERIWIVSSPSGRADAVVEQRVPAPAETWRTPLEDAGNPALSPAGTSVTLEIMRVLVVEDERKTASFIRKALQAEGHVVDVLHDGSEALLAAANTPFDVIVLDIMLPGRDGLSVVRQMRERKITVPVLLLSARGEVGERIEGLDAGADDYLPKPFALEEVLARVRALGRRQSEAKTPVLRIADLTLDSVTRKVKRGGTPIDLAPREYLLLEFLMRSAGRICGRMAIVDKVWDYDFDPGSNLVDVYIMRLREKIDAGFEPKLLHTVRGVGYVLKEPS